MHEMVVVVLVVVVHMYGVGISQYREVFVVPRSLRCFRRRRGCSDVRQQFELGRDRAREAVMLVVLLVCICAVIGWLNRRVTHNRFM